MTKVFWEVRNRNSKGATEVSTFEVESEAQEWLEVAITEHPMVSLLSISKGVDGIETQTHARVYHNGVLFSEITEPYRRTKMEENANATVLSTLPVDADAVAIAKAAEKAAKEEAKAKVKAEKEAAKAEKAKEREAIKAAKAAAKAEAAARGETLAGTRGGRYGDADVITFGPNYTGVNPKRANTLAFGSFSHYRDGMTVKEYKESGAHNPMGNINWDADRGLITVTKAGVPASNDEPTPAPAEAGEGEAEDAAL